MGNMEKHYCINCGKEATQLHHVVPQVLGGNNVDNCVWLCDECHGKIHNIEFTNNQLSHSDLTKLGIEKAKHEESEKLISLYEFYLKLQQTLDDNEFIDIFTILDIIDSCSIRGYKKIKEP